MTPPPLILMRTMVNHHWIDYDGGIFMRLDMPPNPLYRAKDPVNALRQLASDTPEYQELTNYLMARNAMPEVKFGYMGSIDGGFERGDRKGVIPQQGRVTINNQYREYGEDPRGAASILGHELTHAAWYQIRKQVESGTASPELVQAFKRLVYDPKKGTWAVGDFAKKLDPQWYKDNAGYRASTVEGPAFGIGNVMEPDNTPSSWKPPAHLDSTLATEFRILQELAQRDAMKNPNKVNR